MDLSDTEKLELEVRRLRAENAALLVDPRTAQISDIARVCMEAVRACDEKLDERGLCRCCQVIATFLQTWRGHMETAFALLDKADATRVAAELVAERLRRETNLADAAVELAKAETERVRETLHAQCAKARAEERAQERERIARAVGVVWPHTATFIRGLR